MGLLKKIVKLKWLPVRHWFDLRQAMGLHVSVRDPADGERYRFVADSLHSYQRAKEFLSKEPQTIDWLRRNVRPTDVFLDIGANVGTFSLFAARHMSADGHVYACEPHLPTAVQLLQNVAANELQSRVSIISIAASGQDGFLPFRYKRWRPGASGSQLDGGPALDTPVGVELKSGMRIDTMVESGVIRAPNLIKIDTDGLEIAIVSGMKGLLHGPNKPRSILVEVQQGELKHQTDLMKSFGYHLAETHASSTDGEPQNAKRKQKEAVFNTVFEPDAK